jgi:hypothetical protein
MPTAHAASRPTNARAAALGALVALALPATGSATPVDSGVKSCPGTPTRPPFGPDAPPTGVPRIDAFDAALGVRTAPHQLLPGTTRSTPGEAMAGHLVGPNIVNKQETFSFFSTGSQVVSGTLTKKVVNATDGTCDYYYTIEVSGTSALGIDRLIIEQFMHPVHHLYGAWRNDVLPMGVPPDHVQRSAGAGDTITFRIVVGVQPGQSSRPLLLDSDVGSTKNAGTLRLRASDGSLSDPIPAWVPNWP